MLSKEIKARIRRNREYRLMHCHMSAFVQGMVYRRIDETQGNEISFENVRRVLDVDHGRWGNRIHQPPKLTEYQWNQMQHGYELPLERRRAHRRG